MRLIPVWVLLYALGIGFALLFWGLATFWGLGLDSNLLSGIAYNITEIASIGITVTPMAGFAALFVGFILLLIRGTFSAGRVVSLIGIWLYYIAALGLVLVASMVWVSQDFRLDSTFLPSLLTAAFVFLLGFFIMRKLNRLQAEYFEY
jgi:hypothetical protein